MSKSTPVKDDKQCFNCVYFDKWYCKILAMIRSTKSFHHCSCHRIKKQKEETE